MIDIVDYLTFTLTGMQGQIWTEVTRTVENFEYMIFPRMLALAERAWHKASWENTADVIKRNTEKDNDWEEFANALGSKELARLDELGIMYALRPPGARYIIAWSSPYFDVVLFFLRMNSNNYFVNVSSKFPNNRQTKLKLQFLVSELYKLRQGTSLTNSY